MDYSETLRKGSVKKNFYVFQNTLEEMPIWGY